METRLSSFVHLGELGKDVDASVREVQARLTVAPTSSVREVQARLDTVESLALEHVEGSALT